ncbi:MAG: ArnT family glycosyltransferase, partial [Anaerolineae bacterium]
MRFRGLFVNTFSADEALFAMWARYIAVWRDPLLLNVPTAVDKPPLLFYLQALFYPLQGPVEWAARLPNFFASILLIPLVGRIGFYLTNSNQNRALLAAAIVSFSPLAIQFSATAFTDPLLTFFVTMALWCAVWPRTHPSIKTSSGLWLGIALLVKYQAILFLPLIWLFEWHHLNDRHLNRLPIKEAGRWLIHFSACLVLLFIWDMLSGGGIDLVSQQTSAYGGFGLISASAFLPRIWAWAKLLVFVLGWTFTLFAVIGLIFVIEQNHDFKFGRALGLLSFSLFYVLLHVGIQSLLEPRYA